MGFYYLDKPPDEPESGWKRYIPGWLKSWWEDASEVFMVTRMVFGIILPILGVLIGFVVIFAGLVFLLSLCSSGGR